MKQLGLLIALIATLATGYALASPVPESLATLVFGVGLVSLATVGRRTIRKTETR